MFPLALPPPLPPKHTGDRQADCVFVSRCIVVASGVLAMCWVFVQGKVCSKGAVHKADQFFFVGTFYCWYIGADQCNFCLALCHPPLHIHTQATGKQIVFVSRCIVMAFGILSGVLAIVLMKIGLSLGWVYLVSQPLVIRLLD